MKGKRKQKKQVEEEIETEEVDFIIDFNIF